MKITTSHIVLSFISLIIGVIAARFVVGRPHPPFDADGTNAILVGPAAKNVSISTDYLWQDATRSDVAVWTALNPKATLYIDFHDEIFDGMTPQPGGLYRVQCAGSRCDSGPLKSGVKHGKPGFKYDQTLMLPGVPTDHADGRIIIKP